MAINIVVPSFGESIREGTIAQWLKHDGDSVDVDEIVVDVESEKATQGIPSPAAGILHIKAKEGDKVEVGAVLGSIDESGAAPKPKPTMHEVPAKERDEKPKAKPAKPETPPPPPVEAAKPKAKSPPLPARERPLSPSARRAARRKDEQVVARPAAETREPAQSADQRVPMSAIRQRIAERLLTSQKATASLTTFNEIDMSAVMELRSRFKDAFKEIHGVSLGFMGFFVKAAVEALRAFPLVNASIDGRDVVLHRNFDVGVAVSTEKGLMVPVIRHADGLSLAEIEKTIAELAVKARDGKIAIADLQGGTFTITNGGVFGSMLSTPILNYPQSAILGMHAIQKRPVVRDDAIVIRPMMYVALTYDHRLIDGRDAVLFLARVKECIECPGRALLEI